MHRFYSQPADFSQKTVVITARDELHHMRDVLRLKIGDTITIFNGQNQEAETVIATMSDRQVEVRVKKVSQVAISGKTKIILACAVPKKAKFESIIEKCTELGVDEIIPIQTKRTEVIFAQEKVPGKQARFQKVAMNAAKQSGRISIPRIHPMTALLDVLKAKDPQALAVIPSLNGQSQSIIEVLSVHKQLPVFMVLIGPEGDFTPDEVKTAGAYGCRPVSLGRSVLKVDTAAISTVALARFLYN